MTIFMVTHKQLFHGQEVRNVYYYETQVGDPSPSEWQDIVDEVRADYVAETATVLVNDWKFYALDYRIVDTAGLPTLTVVPTSGDLVGSSAADSLATQVAMVVNVKGATAKPRLGRVFLTAFSEDEMTNSLWGVSTRGKAEDFIDLQSVLNAAGTNDLQRVAVQWNTGHTMVTAFNNIAGHAAVATAVPATIRSRRIGVGI